MKDFKEKVKKIRARFGVHTLAGRISIMFWIILMVFVLVFGGFSVYYFKTTTRRSLSSMLSLVIDGNARNFNNLISRIDTTTSMFQNNESTLFEYLNTEGNFVEKIGAYNNLENIMNKTVGTTLVSSEEYCGTSFFVDPEMKLAGAFVDNADSILATKDYYYSPITLSNNESVKSELWYKEAIAKNGSSYWFRSEKNINVLCNARMLYIYHAETDVYQRIGVFLTNIDVSWMVKNMNVSGMTSGTIIALSNWNNTIYAERASDIGNNNQVSLDGDIAKKINENGMVITNGGKKYYAYKNQLGDELNLITLIPVREFNGILGKQIIMLIVMAVLVMIAGTVTIFYFSERTILPIKKLAIHMKNNKNLEVIDCSDINDEETSTIYRNYNQFVEQITDLIAQIYDSTMQQKAAEIKALQAQINPHFVYNTLDTICCISLVRDERDIAEILSQLASMMRYNTKEPDVLVPLKKELEFIRSFQNIQTFRDGGCVTINDNADEKVRNMVIPKMIIQPLIENSVFYGVSEDGKVTIDLNFEYTDTELKISVTDSGTGGEATVINEHLEGKVNISKNNSGLGIRNVNERIKLNYGDEYGLHYEQLLNNKMTAIIRVPRIDG